MNTFRSTRAWMLLALALAGGGARSAVSDPGPRPLDARHPALLAGRLDRLRADAPWLDLHAPLDEAEAARLGGYRTPAPWCPEPPAAPAGRRGYRDLHPHRPPWPARVR